MPRLYIAGLDLTDPDLIYCSCGWQWDLPLAQPGEGRRWHVSRLGREKIADTHLLSEHQAAVDYALADCEHGHIRRSCKECEA